MRKFDYSFLNNGLLPANLINITSSIASLKTMAGVRKEEYAKIFTELEAVARVQSVKSSNAIEGIVTSDERIADIVNRDSAPLNHTESEIAGYRDALNVIHLHHDLLDFKQSDILRLHEMMMQTAVSIKRRTITLLSRIPTAIGGSGSSRPLRSRFRRRWSSWSLPIWRQEVTPI